MSWVTNCSRKKQMPSQTGQWSSLIVWGRFLTRKRLFSPLSSALDSSWLEKRNAKAKLMPSQQDASVLWAAADAIPTGRLPKTTATARDDRNQKVQLQKQRRVINKRKPMRKQRQFFQKSDPRSRGWRGNWSCPKASP